MSQKKCPKCGENNPAEAVMCWACYTPLAGGATAMPHASAPVGQSASAERTKNSVAPWQIAVIGVALLVAVVGSFAMMSRAKPDTDTTPYAAPAPPPDVSSGSGPAISTYVEGSAGAAGASAVSPAQPSQPGQMLFTVSLPPKSGVAWGTMAIVPSGAAAGQEAALAAAACQQAVSGGKWDGLYVYVFSDAASAQKFRQYQSGRGGEPLKSSDYNALQSLWSQVPVRYEYSRGNEAIRYPSKSPGGWWSGSSPWHRAKI